MRDLRLAVRSLTRSKGFVVVAVGSLALGLGLSATMFAMLDAVTHPVVTFANADRLLEIRPWFDRYRIAFTQADLYQELRAAPAFDAVVPVASRVTSVEAGLDGRTMTVALVTAPFFSVAGMHPLIGRTFGVDEETTPVAVVSYALWKHSLGAQRLLDTSVTVRGRTYAVIGVLPEGQSYPAEADVWLPQTETAALLATGYGSARPLARLRAGADSATALEQLRALARHLDAVHPAARAPFGFKLLAARQPTFTFLELHRAMVAAAIVVLLIACGNLANITMARGMARRRELAVRLAIGATRGAVIREQLVESVLLALAGGIAGLLLAVWGTNLLTGAMPHEVRWVGILEPRLSWRVFAFALAAAGVSVVVFGLAPIVRVVAGVRLNEPLKEASGATTGRTRGRYSALVIAEVALALVLLMGAGVLLRQVRAVANAEYNFAARELLRASAALAEPGSLPAARVRDADADLATRLRRLAGIRDVAFGRWVSLPEHTVTSEAGRDSATQVMAFGYEAVSGNYLRVFGLPVIAGRDFLDGEGDAGQPAVILSRRAAELLYPDGAAVGRMVQFGRSGGRGPWARIVGIVDDARTRRVRRVDLVQPTFYVARGGQSGEPAEVLLRVTRQEPRDVIAVRHEIAAAGWRLSGGGDLGDMVAPFLAGELLAQRIYQFLDGVFLTMALSALGLAAVGIFGVLSYGVSCRMREFGVRIAIGATPAHVARLVGRDVTVMVLAGTAVGGLVALGAMTVFDNLLMDIPPTDALTLVLSELCVAAAAFAACAGPTLRAMRSDPLQILRAN